MDNLLPTVAAADVTSNEFRETNLPYQQWEASRTHFTPNTPSDIFHLLPPIAGRKERQEACGTLPTSPRIGSQNPHPAPVDRNLSDLYDPSLDPSPIGMEKRGAVQPVRITRVLRHQEPRNREARSAQHLGYSNKSSGSIIVLILNGYNTATRTSHMRGGERADEIQDDTGVDVYLQSSHSIFFEHATLLPQQWICRTLQNGSLHANIPPYEGSTIPDCTSEDNELSFGLTVFLAAADDWSESDVVNDPCAWGNHPGFNASGNDPKSGSHSDENLLKASVEKVTRYVFQAEDGTPGPSRNAFRLQFEPGPLGMELEEDPGRRGIVQIRSILQAGQADQDGRLFVGSLIVAVGGWGKRSSTTTGLNAVELDKQINDSGEWPVIVRSLAEFKTAALSRKSDQLFLFWAIDREAPEVVSALGAPNPTDGPHMPTPGCYSRSPFSELDALAGIGNVLLMGNGDVPSRLARAISAREASRVKCSTVEGCSDQFVGMEIQGGPPGWEPGRSTGTREGGCSQEVRYDDDISSTACGPQVDRTPADILLNEGAGYRSNLKGSSLIDENHSVQRPESGSALGTWEFETGGGIFNENDEGLAARLEFSCGDRERAPGERPVLPLGLEASAKDDFPVFILFCNNHGSAAMQVSWINYDGKCIPRRLLAPGACYFERSFATHPWVIQDIISTPDEYDLKEGASDVAAHEKAKGNCCLVRLGDAMAVSRLAGSFIWNPAGRTISFTKQTKAGVISTSPGGVGAAGLAPIEGSGLDPNKKRFCVAGSDTEAVMERAATARAVERAEKTRILDEIRTWRLHPPGGVGQNAGEHPPGPGLGVGVPNLRFVMIGSQRKV